MREVGRSKDQAKHTDSKTIAIDRSSSVYSQSCVERLVDNRMARPGQELVVVSALVIAFNDRRKKTRTLTWDN